MPLFFQHQINENTRLGIWKIEETSGFFESHVPQQREVSHPHKRLQHMAGRFLLPFLFPEFPFRLIQIADTRKPFLPGEAFHFSILHCGDYAAAIVSKDKRVGIDIEIPVDKILRIKDKFLSPVEKENFSVESLNADKKMLTLLWSCKESVFKWYGEGNVDFSEHIQLINPDKDRQSIKCFFSKTQSDLSIQYRQFDHLILAWVEN
jgi:phosphopantetheinyl transferase